MNFLAALLGGVAEGVYKTGNDAQEEERKVRMKQLDAELEMKRQEAIQAMRDKSDEAKAARVRQANKDDAATVQSAATDIGAKRDVGNIEKARGLISVDPAQREPISSEDVANIRGMVSPEMAKTQYGLDVPSRLQSLRDQSAAEQGIGRLDMSANTEKSIEGERRFAADESRNTNESNRLAQTAIRDENRRVADVAKDDTRQKQIMGMLAKANGGGKDKTPSEVAVTQWYMENRDDPKAMEAWDKTHDSKSKSVVDSAVKVASEKDPLTGRPIYTPEEAVNMVKKVHDLANGRTTEKPTGITKADYDKLPKGASFIAPDGSRRIKP